MPPTTQSNTGAILERIEDLKCDVQNMAKDIKDFFREVQDFRIEYARAHTQVVADTNTHKETLADHERRIKVLESVMSDFKIIKAVAVYLAVIITPAVFGLIWGIITHKITLVV